MEPINLKKPINKDEATLARIQKLHPAVRAEATELYLAICNALTGRAICRFSATLRTFAEQNALYAKGRTAPGSKVTNAKAGQSYHNYGLAVDIVLLKDMNGDGKFETASWETNVDLDGDGKADWMEVVTIFKRYGWEWGGDWTLLKDLPHFQKTMHLSIDKLMSLHLTGKKDKEGYVILPNNNSVTNNPTY